MKRVMEKGRFGNTVWQQDGTKPYQARTVMEYLERQFGRNVLALKSLQGHDRSPSSPDMNPCDFGL